MPVVITGPAEPDKRIHQIHVWIGIHADGGEGILSADMPALFEGEATRHSPLMHSRKEVAELLRPMAEKIRIASMHTSTPLRSIELRTYRLDRS